MEIPIQNKQVALQLTLQCASHGVLWGGGYMCVCITSRGYVKQKRPLVRGIGLFWIRGRSLWILGLTCRGYVEAYSENLDYLLHTRSLLNTRSLLHIPTTYTEEHMKNTWKRDMGSSDVLFCVFHMYIFCVLHLLKNMFCICWRAHGSETYPEVSFGGIFWILGLFWILVSLHTAMQLCTRGGSRLLWRLSFSSSLSLSLSRPRSMVPSFPALAPVEAHLLVLYSFFCK